MQRMVVKVLFFLLLLPHLHNVLAQQHQQHRNIFSLFRSPYRQAEKLYRQNDYAAAIAWYEQALQKNGHHRDRIRLQLANCYRLTHHSKEAESWYKDIMNNKSVVTGPDMIHYAQVLLSNKKYEASKAWFEHYLEEYGTDSLVLNKLKGIALMESYYSDSSSKPVHWLSINTDHAEFCPVFYQQGLLFTSSRPVQSMIRLQNDKDNKNFLDLYYSTYGKDSLLKAPKPWHPQINGSFHEGPVAFFDSCRKAVLTKNLGDFRKRDKLSSHHLGLFELEKTSADRWSEGNPLPFNDPHYSVAHAAVSENGEWLYFSSNKPGGFGGTDLYRAHRSGGGWDEAINLGPSINTSGNELFPSLLQDSILFFSSNGLPGLGGLDIYRTVLSDTGYCLPENMGYPINSSQDDFGIVFSPEKRAGYFSSNRLHQGTDDDLYAFEVIQIYLKGAARSKLKNTMVKDVTVRLYLEDKEVLRHVTDSTGSFLLKLEPGEEYTLVAAKPGYKSITQQFSTKRLQANDTLSVELSMEKEVKTLVKGVVYQNGTVMTDLAVVAMETATLHRDTLLSDAKGEFFFETDPDMEYYLYVDNRHSFGEVLLEASKKTKGTFLLYAKIELHAYDTAFVNIRVKYKGAPVTNATVFIQNNATGKTDTLYTNKKGTSRFVVKSYASYRLHASYNGRTSQQAIYKLNRTSRTIDLYLKEDE